MAEPLTVVVTVPRIGQQTATGLVAVIICWLLDHADEVNALSFGWVTFNVSPQQVAPEIRRSHEKVALP